VVGDYGIIVDFTNINRDDNGALIVMAITRKTLNQAYYLGIIIMNHRL
jgi:hypothetical protein